MVVGMDVGPTVATAAELIRRYDGSTLTLPVGFAQGPALIMDGEDYIVEPLNLAARPCQAAHPPVGPVRRHAQRDTARVGTPPIKRQAAENRTV